MRANPYGSKLDSFRYDTTVRFRGGAQNRKVKRSMELITNAYIIVRIVYGSRDSTSTNVKGFNHLQKAINHIDSLEKTLRMQNCKVERRSPETVYWESGASRGVYCIDIIQFECN